MLKHLRWLLVVLFAIVFASTAAMPVYAGRGNEGKGDWKENFMPPGNPHDFLLRERLFQAERHQEDQRGFNVVQSERHSQSPVIIVNNVVTTKVVVQKEETNHHTSTKNSVTNVYTPPVLYNYIPSSGCYTCAPAYTPPPAASYIPPPAPCVTCVQTPPSYSVTPCGTCVQTPPSYSVTPCGTCVQTPPSYSVTPCGTCVQTPPSYSVTPCGTCVQTPPSYNVTPCATCVQTSPCSCAPGVSYGLATAPASNVPSVHYMQVTTPDGKSYIIPGPPYDANAPWGSYGTYSNWASQFQSQNGRAPTDQDAINFWVQQAEAGLVPQNYAPQSTLPQQNPPLQLNPVPQNPVTPNYGPSS